MYITSIYTVYIIWFIGVPKNYQDLGDAANMPKAKFTARQLPQSRHLRFTAEKTAFLHIVKHLC